jgi:hypothetical protein
LIGMSLSLSQERRTWPEHGEKFRPRVFTCHKLSNDDGLLLELFQGHFACRWLDPMVYFLLAFEVQYRGMP